MRKGKWKISPVEIRSRRSAISTSWLRPYLQGKTETGDRQATPGSLLIPLDMVNSWQDNALPSADRVVADNPAHFSAQVRATAGASFLFNPPVRIQDLVVGNRRAPRRRIEVPGGAGLPVPMSWSAGKSTAARAPTRSGSNSICKDEMSQ